MLFYVDHFVEIWLLPPGNIILLGLLGFFLLRYKPFYGKVFFSCSLFILWLLSTPIIAQSLLQRLQLQYPPLSQSQLMQDASGKSAIVVLEAGLNYETPEYNTPVVSESTLSRLRYAAFLHEKTNIPILVSGNDPSKLEFNQADYMSDGLKKYFGVATRWKESNGFNTAQEGILSVEILKKSGITKIYLVTHAFHMPRAVYAFRNRGLIIIPAPTGFKNFKETLHGLSRVLPSIDALNNSSIALREYIGIFWYQLYYHF